MPEIKHSTVKHNNDTNLAVRNLRGLKKQSHLEELQEAPAGDFVAVDLFLSQVVWMQQCGDEVA